MGELSILLVEDEASLREIVGDALRDAGHQVDEAAGGAQALESLGSDARYDVLLTDMGMPGMSGMELAMEAVKLRPGIAVIIASGFAKAQLPEFPAGFIYFPKPYRVRQLEDLFAELASSRGSPPATQAATDRTTPAAGSSSA